MASLGEIRLFAGNFVPSGWAKCDGSLVTITDDNVQLAELLGTTYGGQWPTNFGLPNLSANAPVHRSSVAPMGHTGSGPLGVSAPPSVQYIIATITPAEDIPPLVGEIRTFAGSTVPRNWLACDGSILSAKVNTYQMLYYVLGNQYGGSGAQGTFALPDFRGKTVSPVTGTDPLGYTVMNFCIAVSGIFPTQS